MVVSIWVAIWLLHRTHHCRSNLDDGFPHMVFGDIWVCHPYWALIHAHVGHLKRPLFSKRKGRMKAEELELGQGKSPEEVPKES